MVRKNHNVNYFSSALIVVPLSISCDYLLRLSDESKADDRIGYSIGELAAMHNCVGLFLGSFFFLSSDAVIEWVKEKPCGHKQSWNAFMPTCYGQAILCFMCSWV
jgi:hypothetical protein